MGRNTSNIVKRCSIFCPHMSESGHSELHMSELGHSEIDTNVEYSILGQDTRRRTWCKRILGGFVAGLVLVLVLVLVLDIQSQLSDTQSQLSDTQSQLSDTQPQLSDTQSQLSDTQSQLSDALDLPYFNKAPWNTQADWGTMHGFESESPYLNAATRGDGGGNLVFLTQGTGQGGKQHTVRLQGNETMVVLIDNWFSYQGLEYEWTDYDAAMVTTIKRL